MKKYLFFSVAIIICAMILSSSVATENEKMENEQEATQILYILKDYHGRLALYKYGENAPYEVFDIQVKSLPETDVKKLKNGINISDEKELEQLINDYTS